MKQDARSRICAISCVLLLSACVEGENPLYPSKQDVIDPKLGLSREDYRGLGDVSSYFKKADGETGNVMEPPIPELAEILAAPRAPKIGETQLVSVAVTDDVPLKDVLIELARLADVDIEVDAGIKGGMTFRAKDRPFNEVIDRICDLAGLRYKMQNNVLRVERDMPYIEMYSLDFLNMDRSSSGSINVNTSVLSSSSGGSSSGSGGSSSSSSSSGGGTGGSSGRSSGLSSGSGTSITVKAESDFWKQFEEGVKRILSYQPPKRVSEISIATQPTAPGLPRPVDPSAQFSQDGEFSRDETPPIPAPVPAPIPIFQNQPSSTSGAGTGSGAVAASEQPFYIINRQASALTISATEKQHALIKEFVRRIQADSTAQVLIEAKIVEVSLEERYQSGINWSQIGSSNTGFSADYSQFPTTVASGSTAPILGTFSYAKDGIIGGLSIDTAVKLVEVFGTTRTLSSPRLHAINNQQAVLTFARNQPYYTLTVQKTSTTSSGTTTNDTTVNSELNTIPIGIIMTLQPSINLEKQEVTLNIRPTLSRLIDFIDDPAIAFVLADLGDAGADISSKQAPIVEVRELDSILKLKSGQVMVIGGLMEDRGSDADQGIPGASSVPWFGNFFKNVNKAHNVSELVIFIRATIVGSTGNADKADQGVYEKFNRDPRPLTF